MPETPIDGLRSRDPRLRLHATYEAAGRGDQPGLVEALLEVALTDETEVRTGFGLNDDTEHVGDSAADSLRRVLAGREGVDPRVRAAVTSLDADDDRVAALLRHLGPGHEPLRRELAESAEGRLRLRAFKADPDPPVESTLLLLDDPSPLVRRAAVQALTFTRTGSAPFLAALRVETDLLARNALLGALTRRIGEPGVLSAVVGLLAGEPLLRQWTARELRRTADPGVGAAVASRILVEDDEEVLSLLLRYQHLMAYAPQLRDLLDRLRRHTDRGGRALLLARVLAEPDGPAAPPDPAAGLSPPQRERLRREVAGWAAVSTSDLPGDLHEAMDEGVRAAASAQVGTAAGWAAELTRLAHAFTAAQLRAGLEPLPPGPLRHLLLDGEDPARSPLVVHLSDGGSAALWPGTPVAVPAGARPERAGWRVPCAACGVQHRVAAALTWRYRDDERHAASEDGYAATLAGACAACRTPGRVEVRVSLATSRVDGAAEVTWDHP
ncbi:hypothetical protein [Phytohabitans houttuyneae]|uniref:HEAT repeat domain-containing protein n=1 Tax=Phytohabitans houttuyneae TaxID=1076126 RepID=A0A6V8KBC6_9ACTN|nr:hypothetical protein [Phytohabitans houttuyneae]GFJ82523.1 hypothetical protein Phou_067030 [Phytohabitans houttuyneae]